MDPLQHIGCGATGAISHSCPGLSSMPDGLGRSWHSLPRRGLLVPVLVAGSYAHVQTRYWLMSRMLGHQYWRLYEPAQSHFADVTLPVARLKKVLDNIDKSAT